MGVDYNGAKLLLWAKRLGASFERTLTLGHQGFDCSGRRLRQLTADFGLTILPEAIERCVERPPMGGCYADAFFQLLGARELVSVDKSNFEGATLLHDLNEAFPSSHRGRYTFVYDGGTLEHVFNYPGALRNCLELPANGGHILTIVPAHGMMGHGFYQISPELVFRVFNAENGFALRWVVLFDSAELRAEFFQVNDPAITGRRTELASEKPMLMAALAQRVSDVPILIRHPQQSGYAADWERYAMTAANSVSAAETAESGWQWRLRTALNPYWPSWLRRWKSKLESRFRDRAGPPRLDNRVHFRRIGDDEIYGQRHGAANAFSPKE
jgi:hypothetical protein